MMVLHGLLALLAGKVVGTVDGRVWLLTRGWHSNPVLREGEVEEGFGVWEWALGAAGPVDIGLPYMLMRHDSMVIASQVPYTVIHASELGP